MSRVETAPPGSAAHVEGETRRGSRLVRALSAWAPAGALVVFLTAAVRAGLPPRMAVAGLLALAVTQVLPGIVLWRTVRPVDGWWTEDVLVGLGLGACLAVGAQTAAGLFGLPFLSWIVGPAIAAMLLAVRPARRRVVTARTSPLPWAWGPLVATSSLLLLERAQDFYRTVPYVWEGGFRTTYQDMPFHLALIGQIAHRGPTEMPHVAMEPLSYHWFSHAWMAQVAQAGGIANDAVLLRLVPPLIGVVVVASVAIAAVRMSGRPWAGPVAAVLAVAAGELQVLRGAQGGLLVHHLSPSLGFSTLILVTLAVVLAMRWRGQLRTAAVAFVPILAFVAAGSKGSALAVLVAGLGVSWLATWWLNPGRRRLVGLDLALVGGVFLVAFVVVFAGGVTSLRLDPPAALATAPSASVLLESFGSPGPAALAGALLLMGVSVLARGAGLLAATVDRTLRRDPATWLLLGSGLAGAGAVAVLSHDGNSQFYFLRNAAPLLAIGSAWGATLLVERASHRWRVLGSGALVGAATWLVHDNIVRLLQDGDPGVGVVLTVGAVLLLALPSIGAAATTSLVGEGRRGAVAVAVVAVLSITTVPGIVDRLTIELSEPVRTEGPDASRAFSDDQISAARWLRDHSAPDDLVMTNRHCGVLGSTRCDSRRFFVAAYSERQVLVEGWAYTESWHQSPEIAADHVYKPFWNRELRELNDRFLTDPSLSLAQQVRELGVDWVFVDKTDEYSERLAEFAEPRHETQWAWVLQL